MAVRMQGLIPLEAFQRLNRQRRFTCGCGELQWASVVASVIVNYSGSHPRVACFTQSLVAGEDANTMNKYV